MSFHVSLVGRRDLGGEIYRQLRRAILEGRLRPGDRLPSSRELARTSTVSRMTATVAYDRLTGEGLVIARVGAGTVVSQHATGVMRHERKDRPVHALGPERAGQLYGIPTPVGEIGNGSLC